MKASTNKATAKATVNAAQESARNKEDFLSGMDDARKGKEAFCTLVAYQSGYRTGLAAVKAIPFSVMQGTPKEQYAKGFEDARTPGVQFSEQVIATEAGPYWDGFRLGLHSLTEEAQNGVKQMLETLASKNEEGHNTPEITVKPSITSRIDYKVCKVYRNNETQRTAIKIACHPDIIIRSDNIVVEYCKPGQFARDYTLIENYPVRRAAELFFAAPIGDKSPEANAVLQAIMTNPVTAYEHNLPALLSFLPPLEDTKMAKATATQKTDEKATKPGKAAAPAPGKAAAPAPGKAAAPAAPAPGKAAKGEPKGEPKAEAPKGEGRGRPTTYAGRKIKVLNKAHGAREGTKRAIAMNILIAAKNTDDALEQFKSYEGINASFIKFAVDNGIIELS